MHIDLAYIYVYVFRLSVSVQMCVDIVAYMDVCV